MRKQVLSIIILSVFMVRSVYSGIPVIDATAVAQQQTQLAETIKNWAEEAKRWKETAEHYKSQIDAYEKQFKTVTGMKNIEGLLNKTIESQLEKLPDFNNLLLNGKEALSSELKNKLDELGIFDNCDKKSGKTACEAVIINTMKNIEQSQKFNVSVTKNVQEIDTIISRMKASQDIKETADLSNLLSSKVATLQAQKIQYDIFMAQQESTEKILQEQKQKAFREEQRNAPLPKFKPH